MESKKKTNYVLYLFIPVFATLGISLLVFLILALIALSPCLTLCYLISTHYEYRTVVARRSFASNSKNEKREKGNNENILGWLASLDLGGREKK